MPISRNANAKYRSSEIGSVESIGGSSRLIAFLFAELDGILNGVLAAAAPSTVNVDLRILRGIQWGPISGCPPLPLSSCASCSSPGAMWVVNT